MKAGAAATIYALSSGNPPAAIAIVRISGPAAASALRALAGTPPEPRRASFRALHDPASGELLDRALLLWFPGPDSSTGEDLAELHLHGGRSVVAAALGALSRVDGLRPAEPGEFTRRSFENGRIDLAEAEGLSDLLTAETQSQRRSALALAGGSLSRKVEQWQQRLLGLAAQLEAALDFSDEGDVAEEISPRWSDTLNAFATELESLLKAPSAERLKDGVRVAIAGPPNAGKSSLLNYIIGREAAITSAIPGTTRDLVEAPVAIGGVPFLFVDTAGLRESGDEVEAIGVERARGSVKAADLILWLGTPEDCPDGARSILVQSKSDLGGEPMPGAHIAVSARTGANMDHLIDLLMQRATVILPQDGEVALNARHRRAIEICAAHLRAALAAKDPLIAAEEIRGSRHALDMVTGRAGVEDMLDALFGTFCIGK